MKFPVATNYRILEGAVPVEMLREAAKKTSAGKS